MTITATPSEISYAADSITVVFAIPFPFDTAADIKITSTDASGNILTLTTGFTISGGAGSTGNATFSVAPVTGLTLTIYDDPARTQPTDYVSLDAFPAESHERALDRVTRLTKRLYQLVQRSVRFPDGDVSTDGVLGSVANRKGKYLFFNAVTGAIEYAANIVTTTLSQSTIAGLLNPQTPAESAASVTPTNLFRVAEPYDMRREGALVNNAADDTAALNNTLKVATQSVNGAQGAAITVPTGISVLSSMVTLPNRVRVLGQSKRGSYFQAKNTWNSGTSPWMFNAKNGTTAMFDSTLENVTIDANSITGLGCVLSDAWQDDCGMRGVMLINFMTTGLKFQNGYGGAWICRLIDVEMFGGNAVNCIGIDLQTISSVGGFMLNITGSTINGYSAGQPLDKAINVVSDSLMLQNFHCEFVNRCVYLNGPGNHVLIGVTGGPSVTTLVEIDAAFTGTVQMIGCFRNTATNFVVDHRVKQIVVLGAITGGAAYVNGTYTSVPLTGGTGTNATATITVAGGAVTAVSMQNPGTNYLVADALSASNANLGGAGAGFSVPVAQVFTGVGTITGYDVPNLTLGPYNTAIRSLASALAWCVFDGTATGTNAPANGFGVTSVTRTGTGRYTVNLARTMPNVSSCPIATCANPSLLVAAAEVGNASVSVSINNTSLVATDNSEVKLVVFGS